MRDSPGGDRPLSFGCGQLRVPLDYRDPSRKAIDLFLVRVRLAGQQKRIGSLVVNPGGPGGSGVDAAVGLGLSLPTDVLKRFDVVGFDPRGVGLSAPVECISDQLKDQSLAARPGRAGTRSRRRCSWPGRSPQTASPSTATTCSTTTPRRPRATSTWSGRRSATPG